MVTSGKVKKMIVAHRFIKSYLKSESIQRKAISYACFKSHVDLDTMQEILAKAKRTKLIKAYYGL